MQQNGLAIPFSEKKIRAVKAPAAGSMMTEIELNSPGVMGEPGTDEEKVQIVDRGACICSNMCWSTRDGIGKALVDATCKAAVYQTGMKPFANPKAQVGPLSSELVEKLEQCVKPDTILSNLSANINEWTAGKRGMFTLNFWQEDSIASLQADVARGDGWAAADVSRAARTLLLAYDRRGLAHCEEAFASPEELLAHKEVCAFRPVECQNRGCVQVVGANSAGAHDASCPHKLLKCPQGCGADVKRAALREHMATECDMKPAVCPYKELGCQHEVTAGTVEAHCRECAGTHLKLVVDWVGRLSTEAVATEARVRDIKLLLQGVVPKVEETAAEVVAGGEARGKLAGEVRELRASLNGMAKAVTALEGEMKTQKSDMKLAIKTMDRLARAQEDMVKRVPMLSGKS